MAKAKSTDRIQCVTQTVQQVAANTGATNPFATTISTAERVGMEILRVQYDFVDLGTDPIDDILGIGHGILTACLTMINGNAAQAGNIDPLLVKPSGVLDFHAWYNETAGAVIAPDIQRSVIHDFKDAPLIAHPAALYAGVNTLGVAGQFASIAVTLHFRYLTLSDADYTDILQGIIIQNAI